MGAAALVLAASSLAALWIPKVGMYASLAVAILAVAAGWVAYRRSSSPGPARLCGAGAVAVGAIGGLLASAKIVLTLLAIEALSDFL